MLHPDDTGAWGWIAVATCVGVMAVMVHSDLREAKIPNKLTYPAAAVGVLLHLVSAETLGAGLAQGFGGLSLGFGILFLGYMFGGIGGGDVKAAGALGALTGINTTAYGLLYTGLLGGAIAMGLMIWKGRFLSSMKNIFRFFFTALIPVLETEMPKEENQIPFPLGVALAGGWLWAMTEEGLLNAMPLIDLGI
jgi:prepilin peptidase CpaA